MYCLYLKASGSKYKSKYKINKNNTRDFGGITHTFGTQMIKNKGEKPILCVFIAEKFTY